MISRRDLAKNLSLIAAGLALGGEAAYAQQHRKGQSNEVIFLNANENPDGPPVSSIEAMSRVLSKTGRYHDDDNDQFNVTLAKHEGVKTEQILVGSGSSEILHCTVDAFTSATRPLITSSPAYEQPVELATALGHPVIKLPMTPEYSADVHQMVAEAEKAKGGLIYVVNPNNPTASLTPKRDISWLCENLPANTVALIDEAYSHFTVSPEMASALPYVKQGKNVIVCRTFSKIYGMAGLRVGYGIGRADLISKMSVYRNNVISFPGLVAAATALAESPSLVPSRRAKFDKVRNDLCGWLDAHKFTFIPSHANFIMIDIRRDVRTVIPAMMAQKVAVGRPFPPMDEFLRITLGTEPEMAKFKQAFAKVMNV